MTSENIHDNERVAGFARVAEEYCHLIESHVELTKEDFVKRCAVVLPRLFGAATNLVDVPVEVSEDIDLDGMTCGQGKVVRDELAKTLGEDDVYWIVFDPYKDETPVASALSDDLADIYRDVKDGLMAYGKTERDRQEAVWQWRFSFVSHWGHHCSCVLQPIHCLLKRIEAGSAG